MSSAKQIHANRLNAKSSSGPNTEQGKRTSALNATRHGLSSPLDPPENAQSIDAIAALLENELGSLAAARGVAIKILDYERNEAQQRLQLQAMARGPSLSWRARRSSKPPGRPTPSTTRSSSMSARRPSTAGA